MICIMFVFGTFLGGSKLGDSGYDIENEVTTAQPSTTTSKIRYFLASVIQYHKLSNIQFISDDYLTAIEILNASSVCKSKMQYTYNYQIYISSKLPIISVEAGGEESWISDDSCDDVNNNQFCNYDGGDCCGANVVKQYCIDCDCLGK